MRQHTHPSRGGADGAAIYPAMFAAIRSAHDHINLESYIIEDDEVGRQSSELLLTQQARGVQFCCVNAANVIRPAP